MCLLNWHLYFQSNLDWEIVLPISPYWCNTSLDKVKCYIRTNIYKWCSNVFLAH